MVLIYINPKIKQVNFPNKGRGFISTNTINKGEIVLIEKPDIFVEKFVESPLFELIYQIVNENQIDNYNKFIPNQIDTYENTFINELKNLSNKQIKNKLLKFNDEQLSLLIRKYLQNVFNMDNTKKSIKPCVLYYGAIFNHSCQPNIDFKFDSSNYQMIFFANKKIGKNVELFDSYIDTSLNYKDRQERLQFQYKFKCECEKCLDESTNIKSASSKSKNNII